MRKIALFLSLCVFIWASDLQQALEYEKQGDYKKLWKFTKTRFKNSSVLISQEQNNSSQATQTQNSITIKRRKTRLFSLSFG